jgi:hypothetical protein
MRWLRDAVRKFNMYRGDERFIQVLVGKTEGKILPGRPRRRWENIYVDLQEM